MVPLDFQWTRHRKAAVKTQWVRNPLIPRLFILATLFGILVSGIVPSTAAQGPGFTSVTFDGQLKFEISGVPGFYPAAQPLRCTIRADRPIQIQFAATPLSCTGKAPAGSGLLDVTYWLNQPQKNAACFKPKPGEKSLTIYRDYHQIQSEVIPLYGGIAIDTIDAQPAGVYRGDIVVTVAPQN